MLFVVGNKMKQWRRLLEDLQIMVFGPYVYAKKNVRERKYLRKSFQGGINELTGVIF